MLDWTIAILGSSVLSTRFIAKLRRRDIFNWTGVAFCSFLALRYGVDNRAWVFVVFLVPLLLFILPRVRASRAVDRLGSRAAFAFLFLYALMGVMKSLQGRVESQKEELALRARDFEDLQQNARNALTRWALGEGATGSLVDIPGYKVLRIQAGEAWKAAITSVDLIAGRKDVYVVSSEGVHCAVFDAIKRESDPGCDKVPPWGDLSRPEYLYTPAL